MDKDVIFDCIKSYSKQELLTLLDKAWEELSDAKCRNVFGHIKYQLLKEGLDPVEHQDEVEAFCDASYKQHYYTPFNINSKNYRDIPEKTDEWFATMGELLDLTCDLVEQGEKEVAKTCFEQLYKLIETMENGEDIVFADEYGSWMIQSEKDYEKIYQSVK